MKKGTSWLLVGAALTLGPVALAQDGAPKPTAEHKRLGYFVGTWRTEGEMKPGPMGPGGKMTGTDKCSWYDGGFAVVCNSEGTMPTGSMKSIGIMGYNAEEKVYTWMGTDSSGMTMTTVPRGTLQGDTWTYNDESVMGGQKMKSRVVIKELSPTAYTFQMDFQGPDGKWVTAMESKSTKVK
jgi:uncharacterized protein DUF1579